jgi:hypothetical protein
VHRLTASMHQPRLRRPLPWLLIDPAWAILRTSRFTPKSVT